jgi:H3 lysine-79-specific histone-lysine N-methyltransferase
VNRQSSATASPAPILSDSEPGSDDDDDWRERLDPSKRRKRAHTEDPDRRLRHPRLWSGQGEDEKLGFVHSVEVASLLDKCQPVMNLARDEVAVRLRYPGAKDTER